MLEKLPADVEALIGKAVYHEESEITVESGYIYTTCASVQNGNALYWDKSEALALTGGLIAPPTMLSTWFRPHHWRPGSEGECKALQAHFDLKDMLELPEAIISDNELQFGEPVRLGDKLRSYQVIRSISGIKTTKLGTGRFWVIDVVYENQKGIYVGTDSYTAFGYVRDKA